jgi:hypothetical protein
MASRCASAQGGFINAITDEMCINIYLFAWLLSGSPGLPRLSVCCKLRSVWVACRTVATVAVLVRVSRYAIDVDADILQMDQHGDNQCQGTMRMQLVVLSYEGRENIRESVFVCLHGCFTALQRQEAISVITSTSKPRLRFLRIVKLC